MQIPDGLPFDELNKLYAEEKDGDLRSMPFEQFFGEMDLSPRQKERRIRTAREIKDFMMIALAELYYGFREGDYTEYDPFTTVKENYSSMLERLAIPLTALFEATHPNSVAADIVAATMNNEDDAYFYSEDRATLIAENEANSIWNDSEFQDAILTGKTMKRWSAILDRRTRETHRDINGIAIPIMEPFMVGDSMMMYPHDESMGASAEEIVNCRCSVTYY